MIVNERVVSYINSLDRGNSDICNTIEKEAIEDQVPIIRKEMGNLLKVLLKLKQPGSILEVGTAVGYSSILMSENMPKDCRIVTIENYDKRIQAARNNIKRAGKEDCIQLIEGDALKVLKELEGPYDFIFMDAAKGQYINYLPDILRLMPSVGSSSIRYFGSVDNANANCAFIFCPFDNFPNFIFLSSPNRSRYSM